MKIIELLLRGPNGGECVLDAVIFYQRDDLASERVLVAGSNGENCDEKNKWRFMMRWNERRLKWEVRLIDGLWSVSLTALSYAEAWMWRLSVVKRSSRAGGGAGCDGAGLAFGAIRFQAANQISESCRRQLTCVLCCVVWFSRERKKTGRVGCGGFLLCLLPNFCLSLPLFF